MEGREGKRARILAFCSGRRSPMWMNRDEEVGYQH